MPPKNPPAPTPAPLLAGDLNGVSQVDIADLVIVGVNFGTGNSAGDANRDGWVDIADLVIVGSNFGKTSL